MCISFANEGKTQVGWVAIIGRRTWKWASANNIPPKGSPYCVWDSNEMIMRSHVFRRLQKNIVEMGVRKTNEQMGKVDPRC
jgi:hypothetical protein